MATIAGFTVATFRGHLSRSVGSPTVDLVTRDGVDGTGIEVGAYRQDEVPVQTTSILTGAQNPILAIAQMRALAGTVQTVVDQFGVTWTGTRITRVRADYKARIGGGWQVDADWYFLVAADV